MSVKLGLRILGSCWVLSIVLPIKAVIEDCMSENTVDWSGLLFGFLVSSVGLGIFCGKRWARNCALGLSALMIILLLLPPLSSDASTKYPRNYPLEVACWILYGFTLCYLLLPRVRVHFTQSASSTKTS
jgi:hypothetical protein